MPSPATASLNMLHWCTNSSGPCKSQPKFCWSILRSVDPRPCPASTASIQDPAQGPSLPTLPRTHSPREACFRYLWALHPLPPVTSCLQTVRASHEACPEQAASSSHQWPYPDFYIFKRAVTSPQHLLHMSCWDKAALEALKRTHLPAVIVLRQARAKS